MAIRHRLSRLEEAITPADEWHVVFVDKETGVYRNLEGDIVDRATLHGTVIVLNEKARP